MIESSVIRGTTDPASSPINVPDCNETVEILGIPEDPICFSSRLLFDVVTILDVGVEGKVFLNLIEFGEDS